VLTELTEWIRSIQGSRRFEGQHLVLQQGLGFTSAPGG
jgi:hypothetical protein